MTGSERNLSHAPERVMIPLIMPPQEGISRMTEKVAARVETQSGSAVQCR